MRQEGEVKTLFVAEARVPEMARRKQAIFEFNRSLTLGLVRALPRILCSAWSSHVGGVRDVSLRYFFCCR
jgi:hypothetical protein